MDFFTDEINQFLESKSFTANTKANYLYDLRKLAAFYENKKLTSENLQIYRESLKNLSISAQKRKISSANQFFKYLYQKKMLNQLFQIDTAGLNATILKQDQDKISERALLDFTKMYGPIGSLGQFIALLILEFGLTFADIQKLKWEDFNWNYKILTIENSSGLKRVLPIREKFAIRVRAISNANELFAKSRQFLYLELKKSSELTAKELREQFILRQVKEGKSIYQLAEALGMLTIVSLEKYYR